MSHANVTVSCPYCGDEVEADFDLKRDEYSPYTLCSCQEKKEKQIKNLRKRLRKARQPIKELTIILENKNGNKYPTL